MSNNFCSEVLSSSSCRNSSHVPVTSPVTSGLCSTETRNRDAPCSPTSSLGSNTPRDNCQEPCSEPRSCQSTSCNRSAGSPSVCSPITSGISGSQEGTSCLPNTSHNSSFCRPTFCGQPMSCYVPSYLYNGCQPLGYLTYGRPPLRNLTYGCQSSSSMPSCYRPTSYKYNSFQPYSSSLSGWHYPY
ncbi:keratin-associated protein 26-1-like [Grammomys surdaster]|uniref:keratin-associated protein 26-1-like n=1 Tax=Grammomys surdaster TaxID=491861 RepID=UPI00109F1F39|nr:keratin-associated protein 26-1-like [Grammomys surdaster]